MRRDPKKNPSSRSPSPVLSNDEVAREAFRLYQARHGAPGDPVADWFEAERIVRSRQAPAAPKAAEAAAGRGGSTRRTKPIRRRR
jgi:hypothetical protein